MPNDPCITRLILQYRNGDRQALDALLPLVYAELRGIARRQLSARRSGHTLVPTALVNEAFVRLLGNDGLVIESRAHFFAIAAQCMRWVLRDHARAKRQAKRGGDPLRVTLNENSAGANGDLLDLVALNNALEKLDTQAPRLARVVELRALAGLSVEETARVMNTSVATVKRDWVLAKSWIHREMVGDEEAA